MYQCKAYKMHKTVKIVSLYFYLNVRRLRQKPKTTDVSFSEFIGYIELGRTNETTA